jgi:hypothetical protein
VNQPIAGYQLADQLIKAGIIPAGDKITRVVIDAPAGNVVKIHVERVGDERLLQVVPSLEGVRISTTRVGRCSDPGCECRGDEDPGPIAVGPVEGTS